MSKSSVANIQCGWQAVDFVNFWFLMMPLSFIFCSCPCLNPFHFFFLLGVQWFLVTYQHFIQPVNLQAAHGFLDSCGVWVTTVLWKGQEPPPEPHSKLPCMNGAHWAGSGRMLEIEPNTFCKQQLNEVSCHEAKCLESYSALASLGLGQRAETGDSLCSYHANLVQLA